jgi:hypothetical protein
VGQSHHFRRIALPEISVRLKRIDAERVTRSDEEGDYSILRQSRSTSIKTVRQKRALDIDG